MASFGEMYLYYVPLFEMQHLNKVNKYVLQIFMDI